MTFRRWAAVALASLAGLLFGIVPSGAQGHDQARGLEPAVSRVELGAGWIWNGKADLGRQPAALTPNVGGSAYALFEAGASFGTPLGGAVRVGYRVRPWLVAGLIAEASRGDVQVRIDGDREGAAAVRFAGESFSQVKAGGRVDVVWPRPRFAGGRVTPHASLFAGVLRQWHQGNVLIDTGRVYEGGAGVRIALARRPASRLSRIGVLAEVRVSRVSGGFHWGRELRTAPAATMEFYTGWGR